MSESNQNVFIWKTFHLYYTIKIKCPLVQKSYDPYFTEQVLQSNTSENYLKYQRHKKHKALYKLQVLLLEQIPSLKT